MSGIAERLAEVLAAHVLYGEGGDENYECKCGVIVPTEVMEDGEEHAWHHAHVAEIQAELVEREIAAARGEALRSPYDEDGNCEGCGNGSWKAHAPTCGWADLADARAEGRAEVVTRVEALADSWAAIPPYLASDYDRGRVDQREMCETELRAALSPDPDRGEGEA